MKARIFTEKCHMCPEQFHATDALPAAIALDQHMRRAHQTCSHYAQAVE